MKYCPFYHESRNAGRETTGENGKVTDVYQCKIVPILRMKMRRAVIVEEHFITMPKNRLISGMSGLVMQRGEKVIRFPTRHLNVEGVRTKIDTVLPYKLSG